MRLKEILVNWFFKGAVINRLHTRRICVVGGSTFYIDLLDMDHKSSDPSATESQMWYNSTNHVMRYRNDSETVDF